MLFSIIIPTYNYADYLSHAILSACDQGGDDYEVIVVDDGSTDHTQAACETLMAAHPNRLQYLHQTNQGPAAARTHGATQAQGQYFLFLDADDRLLPDALTHFRNALQNHPEAAMIFAGHRALFPGGKVRVHQGEPVSENKHHNFITYLNKGLSVCNGGNIMHRKIFDRLTFPTDLRNGEDFVVFAQVFAYYPCASIPTPVVDIYKHNDSLRHNIESQKQALLVIGDHLFNPDLLPTELLPYKQAYTSMNYLSLCRSFLRIQCYGEAIKAYHRAIALHPKHIFKLAYLRKYLKGLGKLLC